MKATWSQGIEPLLKLRTLNAAFRLEMLSLLPGDEIRVNDWHDR